MPTTPTTSPIDSPAARFLRDPGQTLRLWRDALLHAAAGKTLLWLTIAALAALIVVTLALVRFRRRRSLLDGARFVEIEAPPTVDDHAAEALWAHLTELLRPRWARRIGGQPHLSFEYRWSAEGLTVGMWVPGPIPPGLVERAISAAWPGASCSTQTASSPIPKDARVAGGELRPATAEWFPLRTEHPTDPLRPLLAAAADPTVNESTVIQVLARPVTARRRRRARRALVALRRGTPQNVLGRPASSRPGRPTDDPVRAVEIRAVLTKVTGPAWEAVVRYAVADAGVDSSTTTARLRGRAHAVASAFGIYAGHNHLARHHLRHPARTIADRLLGRAHLVSVAELAALAHLPLDTSVPGLARAGAQTVPPAPGIPMTGKVFGEADAGSARPVALAPVDGRYHLHVIGATGSGKSTLLVNLALQDIAAGRGTVVIDPKGDLVADILDRIPADAARRTVVIDPDDSDAPPSLNVLDGPDPDLAVDHVVGIFRRIFESYWGPRTDDVLRAACLTLLRRPGATLADVPRLLGDSHFRSPLVAGLHDRAGLGGFWSWYDALGDAQQAQVIGPVMNKLRAFLLRDFVRDIVGSATSSFDLTDVLDGGVCLVRIPKGILGEDTCRLLGSFVVAKVWQAATLRARQHQHARVDATLYVDECQNFLTLPRSFDEMLAEARGYGLSLVLAHQHLAQLPRELRDAISANARNKAYFAVSPEDARTLERHVQPHLNEHDLGHLAAYQAAVRLVVSGGEQPACTLRTRPAPPVATGRAEQIRAASRQRYGRSHAQRQLDATQRSIATSRPPGRHPAHPGAHQTARPWVGGPFDGEPAGQAAAGPPTRNPDSRERK